MPTQRNSEKLGMSLSVQRPRTSDMQRFADSQEDDGKDLQPVVDADGNHVHFEMVPMGGESMLWLTLRRGTSPEVASHSLRKIAALIDRHGERLLMLLEGSRGSFDADGGISSEPLNLDYDENGDLIFPDQSTKSVSKVPR